MANALLLDHVHADDLVGKTLSKAGDSSYTPIGLGAILGLLSACICTAKWQ